MNQPRHTPAEAVQYWYDAAAERREERDRLRAVVARIAQMADYWEQHLPEVIRTPAVVSAIRAALEPAEQSPDRPFRDEPTEVLQTALDLANTHARQAARFRPQQQGDALPAVADLFQAELQHREGRAPLRQRAAAAMREHWLYGEPDADGNLSCRCGNWREPGAAKSNDNDWDSHLADVALAAAQSPADRAALRDRIAEALMQWAERNNSSQYASMRRPEIVRANAYSRADAVLAVLPEPAVRAVGQPVCDLPHETIAEEDACDRRPAADRAELRDRIVAEVQRLHDTGGMYALDAGEPERIADAVLAVLPEVADRAAVLLWAADQIDAETRQAKADGVLEPDKYRPCRDASAQLRRLAGEQPAQDEADNTAKLPPMDPWRLLGVGTAPDHCTGQLGFCAEHGVHRPGEAHRPTLRERHRAAWNALTPAERDARIAALDAIDPEEQATRCPHGCDVSRCPCLACEADAEARQPTDEARQEAPPAEACPPGCIACATDESHDPPPA